MSEQVVHIRSMDGGQPEASICDGSVADVANETLASCERFGHPVSNKSTTRTLDGWLVRVDADVTVTLDGRDYLWHHTFARPSDQWGRLSEATR